jgi:hypothetical protein
MLSLEIFSQSLWKLKKNKEGIKVFTRTENNSDFKSFKATTIVNASIEKTLKVFKKTEDYPKWYGYTKTSKLLKQENDVQYNYVETIFPWPFKNRDMVYEMTTRYLDANVVKTTLKGIPNYIQEKKGIVRMVKAEGYILLESSSNKTKITYVFHSEPGDNIPAWMANNSIAKLPFKTMLGLRKTLEKNNE